MEKIIKSVRVFNKNCLGCKRHKKDIMLALQFLFEGDDIHDFFFSKKLANEMLNELKRILKEK